MGKLILFAVGGSWGGRCVCVCVGGWGVMSELQIDASDD